MPTRSTPPDPAILAAACVEFLLGRGRGGLWSQGGVLTTPACGCCWWHSTLFADELSRS
jgi:hypothetical protein